MADPITSTADARVFAWKWLAHLEKSVAPMIAAAQAAPTDYAKAQEVVTMLDMLASQARAARDSLPPPEGTPKDQLGWLRADLHEALEAQRDMSRALTREFNAMAAAHTTALSRVVDDAHAAMKTLTEIAREWAVKGGDNAVGQ